MKVKIGNEIYDSINQPIMIILDIDDIENISSMSEDNSKYCSYPEQYKVEEIKKFMNL